MTFNLELQDMARSELQRIPAEYLQNIGSISSTPTLPCEGVFEAEEPFSLEPYKDHFADEESRSVESDAGKVEKEVP